MPEPVKGPPLAGPARVALDSGPVGRSGPAASPPTAVRQSWLRWVAALLAALYLAGAAIGWATNAVAGYHGITRVDTPSDALVGLVVLEVAPGSPADRAGLQPGDVILAVDGKPVSEAPDARLRVRRIPPSAEPDFRLRPLAVPTGDAPAVRRAMDEREPGEQRTLRVQRPGLAANDSGGPAVLELTLTPESRLAAAGVVAALLTWNLVGLLTLAVGVVVALRRPRDLAARLLLVMGACFAFALVLLSWNNRPLPPEVALTLVQTTMLLLVLGCAALLHLFLAFPAPHPFLTRLRTTGPAALRRIGGAAAALYALPLALALGFFLGPVVVWPWSYLIVTALTGLALLALARSVLYPSSPVARAQLKWIAGALAIGLIALILGPGVNVVTGARDEALSPIATVAAWALFPLAVGVAVMRYRLFDIDLVLRAAMFYPLLAALLAGGYLATALGLSRAAVAFIGPRGADNPGISVLAALLVAAIAQPIHHWLQGELDRFLYRDRLARQRLLQEASVVLGRALPPEDVAAFLTGHVAKRLGLVRAWLALPGHVTASDGTLPATLLETAQPLLARMHETTAPLLLVARDDLAVSGLSAVAADESALQPWYAAGARLLLPLRTASARPEDTGDRLLGVWLVGLRQAGAWLGTDDVEALTQVARQAAVLLDYDRLHWQQAAEMQRTARFRRYFSPQIADLIAGERAELGTHRRQVTVLVAHLHGFATFSERVEPEEVVELLNTYLAAMTDVVFAHGGTLDMYQSDGMIAFFGDPLPQPDHAGRAVGAALAMQRRFTELRQAWPAGRGPLSMGIGLATGWVTAGTIGSTARQEYTVVGDAASIAARLADAAGPGEVLLEEQSRRLLGDDSQVVARGELSLPGRQQPVPVFTTVIDGAASPARIAAPASPPEPSGDGREHTVDTNAVAVLLARTPLFTALPREELLGLANRLRLRRFKRGATIVGVDALDSGFCVIQSGTVKVTRPLPTGDEAVMNILGAGEFFGEVALLDGRSGAGTVVALESTEILLLSREDFLGYLQTYPSAASTAISLLSERIRRLGDQLEESYAMDLPQRLARRLLDLGRSHGKRTAEGLAIDLPLTQSDLAGMVGTSRQRVNRQLAEWQDRQWLRLGPHGAMVLLQPDALAELSQAPAHS